VIDIRHGDCLEVLRAMPDGSVDAVVTDPPYGLSFMGKKWDYDVPSVEIWQECLRVLKPGGHLLAFAGTRTQHRMAVRIEDAGFEIRDMIAWVYGSGFPKSHNLSGDWQGWGTALKPALEPITVARKPLVGAVAANVLEHGTGALNVDGCRVGTEAVTINTWNDGAKPFGGGAGHAYTGRTVVGRWPANLIHDGSDEVVRLFPVTTSGGGDKHGRKPSTFCASTDWEAFKGKSNGGDSGSAARFFYQVQQGDSLPRKGGYNEVWQDQNLTPSSADTAVLSSSLQSALAATVQKAVAIWPSLAGILLSEQSAAFTTVTLNESKAISETAMQAMASIASGFSQESQHERRTPCNSLVRSVAIQKPTGITTITTSLCKSNGSVESATFNITPSNLDRGVQVSRLNYCAKASKRDRDEGCDGLEAVHRANGNKWTDQDYRVADGMRTDGRESGPRRNHHPTVKPTDLMRYLCRLVTPPGGVVLDPFCGSGSTGKAAVLEGFRFIGIERDPQYVEIARARVAAVRREPEQVALI